MVTKKFKMMLYKLHFEDLQGQNRYEFVQSRNINTLLYYAKRMLNEKSLMLVDFYEIYVISPVDKIWLTKYKVEYRKSGLRFRRYLRTILDAKRSFDEILQE